MYLKPGDEGILKELRKDIARDHFKLQLYYILYTSCSELTTDEYAQKRLQYEFERESNAWKCYYGKNKSDVDLQLEQQNALDELKKKAEEDRLKKLIEEESKNNNPEKMKDLQDIATIIHFQMRVNVSMRL